MEFQTITAFFMWCTIINGGLWILSAVFFMFAPDFVYRKQNRLFPLPRETYNVVIYSFLGLFKVLILVFNVVPYVTLLIVA